MERPDDSSGYRIPSHVFARDKSSTLNGEWSTASNESLFSIHTGNMSFIKDQFSYLTKSGEIPPLSPIEIRNSEEMPSVPSDSKNSGEEISSAHLGTPSPLHSTPSPQKVDTSPRFSEASAIDLASGTKKDEAKKGKPSMDEIPFSNSTLSHHSEASGQSFAFPVLTDIDRQKSVNSGASRGKRKDSQSTYW